MLRLDLRDIEAIAQRVVELQRVDQPALLDAAELGRRLGISRDAVYRMARAGKLPSVRVGDGPKAPMRFDVHACLAALDGDRAYVEGTHTRPAAPAEKTRLRRRSATSNATGA
jgi:excisionase family DNA binding protein